MTRQDVHRPPGQRVRSADGGDVPVLGPTARRNRYAFEGFTMHLEYPPDSAEVLLVSLALPGYFLVRKATRTVARR